MITENQEFIYTNQIQFRLLVGLLIGGLVGAVTMLLVAPKSGKDTRKELKERSIQLYDHPTDIVIDSVAQVRSNLKNISSDGRDKVKEFKPNGQ